MHKTYIKRAHDNPLFGRASYRVAQCIEVYGEPSIKVFSGVYMVRGEKCFVITTRRKFENGAFINVKKELGMLKTGH